MSGSDWLKSINISLRNKNIIIILRIQIKIHNVFDGFIFKIKKFPSERVESVIVDYYNIEFKNSHKNERSIELYYDFFNFPISRNISLFFIVDIWLTKIHNFFFLYILLDVKVRKLILVVVFNGKIHFLNTVFYSEIRKVLNWITSALEDILNDVLGFSYEIHYAEHNAYFILIFISYENVLNFKRITLYFIYNISQILILNILQRPRLSVSVCIVLHYVEY